MLNFMVSGPYSDGLFYIVYKTPGCSILTPISQFTNEGAAMTEAHRLNMRSAPSEPVIMRGGLE